MRREGGNVTNLHPRLNVVFLGARERVTLSSALAPHVTLVDRSVLDDRTRAAARDRSDREQVAVDSLEDDLRTLENRRSSAELALADLLHEQDRLREAADWCESQPEHDAAGAAQIAVHLVDVEAHSRLARESTRKLERVLEQRAAAEAALEEARRELSGLGATGIDETDVRRQMEAASQELRLAASEYQDAMTDVARRRAALAAAEEEAASTEEPPAPAVPDGDQLQAMSRALSAKFAPEPAAAGPGEEDLRRLRQESRAAQERADEAAHRLSTARRRSTGFESELSARSSDGDARAARHEAALALEAQVMSVERQLREAEEAARAEVDGATRAMSRTELALERERQEARQRRRQLGELVGLVAAADRPPAEDDIIDHAGAIADALRAVIGPMQDDIDRARTGIETLRAEHADITAELERRRARLHAVVAEDRRTALEALLLDDRDLLVLDDVVSTGAGPGASTAALDAADPTVPVVILTEDPAVAAWAIELPADRGRITHQSELWSVVEVDLTVNGSQTANDQHPEPSSTR